MSGGAVNRSRRRSIPACSKCLFFPHKLKSGRYAFPFVISGKRPQSVNIGFNRGNGKNSTLGYVLKRVNTVAAMLERKIKVSVVLGGNFAMTTPDTYRTWGALRSCDLTEHIATKVNRSHPVHGKDALLLAAKPITQSLWTPAGAAHNAGCRRGGSTRLPWASSTTLAP